MIVKKNKDFLAMKRTIKGVEKKENKKILKKEETEADKDKIDTKMLSIMIKREVIDTVKSIIIVRI